MDIQTIMLIIGIAMIVIGIFGGGFEIKEIKIPKVNVFSRIIGFVVGVLFLLVSIDVIPLLNSGKISGLADDKESTLKEDTNSENDIVKTAIGIREKLKSAQEGWENPEVSNELILAEYKSIQSSEEFEDLSVTEKSKIVNRIALLEKDVSALETLQNFSKNKLTLIERLQLLALKFERLTIKDRKDMEVQTRLIKNIIDKEAHIKIPANFVTCSDVKNLEPQDIDTHFNKGKKVWVWIRAHSPRVEELRLEWYDLNKNELIKIVKLKIESNMLDGFRTTNYKTFKQRGTYEALLYNQNGHLIGRKEFTVL